MRTKIPSLFTLGLLLFVSFAARAEITCDECTLGDNGSVEASCETTPQGTCEILYKNVCGKKSGLFIKPAVGSSFLEKINAAMAKEFPKCRFDFINANDLKKADEGKKVLLKPSVKS